MSAAIADQIISKEIPAMSIALEGVSGLVVAARRLKVSDENLLADASNLKQPDTMGLLLDAITEGVENPGPYGSGQISASGKVKWGEILQGDRLVILKNARQATHPDKPIIHTTLCPRCPAKIGKVDMTIKLADLEIKKLPEISFEHARSGQPIRVKLPYCKKKIGFRLLRGKDDADMSLLQKQHEKDLSSAILRHRLLEVEGVTQDIWSKWVTDLDMEDSTYIRAAYHEADGGLETGVICEHTTCGFQWEEDIQLGRDFLFPKFRGAIIFDESPHSSKDTQNSLISG